MQFDEAGAFVFSFLVRLCLKELETDPLSAISILHEDRAMKAEASIRKRVKANLLFCFWRFGEVCLALWKRNVCFWTDVSWHIEVLLPDSRAISCSFEALWSWGARQSMAEHRIFMNSVISQWQSPGKAAAWWWDLSAAFASKRHWPLDATCGHQTGEAEEDGGDPWLQGGDPPAAERWTRSI